MVTHNCEKNYDIGLGYHMAICHEHLGLGCISYPWRGNKELIKNLLIYILKIKFGLLDMCSMIVVMINAMYMINDKYDMVS